jgi:hypothetical protein
VVKKGDMMARQKSPQQVYCRNCIHNFEAFPKLSFLGFRKFRCPKCNQNVIWPLTAGFAVLYWLVITAAIAYRFASVGGPLQMINVLDVFAFGALIALLVNHFLRASMRK